MKLPGSNNMEDWEHLFLYSMSDIGHFCWGSNLLQSVFEITKCASLSYKKYSSYSSSYLSNFVLSKSGAFLWGWNLIYLLVTG